MEDLSPSAEARLARLEARLAELEAEVAALRPVSAAARASTSAAAPAPPPLPRARVAAPKALRVESLASGEGLARIGIGLLLLGVVFLLKYSIDQGWMGPGMRVALGAALGLGLVGLGWGLRQRRAPLASVLQGGGVAALYGSLFAAFQLYGLVGYASAFALMVGVTALGFALSVLGRNAALSVVAVLGGLGTPFLLTREPGTLVGLMTYTLVVLAGGSAVYARFRWPQVLAAMALGGAFVLGVAALFSLPATAPPAETLAFQAGVVGVWVVATLLPLWPASRRSVGPLEAFLIVAAALGVAAGTAHAWQMGEGAAGFLALALAAAYGTASVAAQHGTRLGGALFVAAALLLAAGGALALEGAFRLLGPALAGALLVRGRASGQPGVALAASGLLLGTSLAAALWMATTSPGSRPFLAGDPYALLVTVALLGVAAWRASRARVPLGLLAYGLLLGWQAYLFSGVPGGGAWASAGWGLTGIAALVAGLRVGRVALRLWGFATLATAIAKLLLFDLPQLSTLARTLLFLGAGAVLLLVSYFVPNLLRSSDAPATPSDG